MKRFLSLALVFILVISSLLLVACDETKDDPATTTVATTAATEPEDEGGSKKPASKPVKVDDVDGKNARELYESAYEEYIEAETYDVEANAIVDGEEEYYIVKIGKDDMYVNINYDGDQGEFWEVDGVLYGIADGEKGKLTGGSLVDMLGESMLEELLVFPFMHIEMEAFLDLMEDAQLYSHKGEFYYELTLTEEELQDLHMGGTESYYEKVCFDADGKITRVIVKSDETEVTFDIHSYGKTVKIKAPADADDFVEMGEEKPGGNTDVERPELQGEPVDTVNGMNAREIMEKFVNDYTTAETFDIEMRMESSAGSQEIIIKVGKDAFYMRMNADGQDMEIWFVDSVCYMKSGNEKYKKSGVSMDDIFGEGGIQAALNQAFGEIDAEFLDELDGVQIYYYEGEYYFYQGEPGDNGTVYVNDKGEITKMIVDADGEQMVIILNGYGKRVTVKAPADANSFVESGNII